MAMSLLTKTISMLANSVLKNGHDRAISCKKGKPGLLFASSHLFTAEPNPYHAGNISRHCAQEKTHGIARRSSMRPEVWRDAGRLPIWSFEISPMTVDS